MEAFMDNLLNLLTYFCMLSIAAERAVELLKNMFLKKLGTSMVWYQVIAGVIGGIMCYYSPPPTTLINTETWVTVIATGLAVSSGSAFWNTMIDTMTAISKNMKAANPTTPAK